MADGDAWELVERTRSACPDVLLADRNAEVPDALARLFAVAPASGPGHRMACLLAFQQGDLAGARDHCDRALAGGATVDPRLLEALSLPR